MATNKVPAGIQNLFSIATRERCIANLKKVRAPKHFTKSDAKNPIPEAAVLVPLCRVNDVTSLLYTVRAANMRSHAGQISFPGGKINVDETPLEAALRETQEEIGLSPTKIDIWGCGNPVPGRNNDINITPVIGTILDLKKEDLKVNTKEVAEVFAVPIDTLCDPKNQYYTQFRNGFILPVFIADNYKIWGITAYLTHAFLTCLLSEQLYRNEWTKKKVRVKIDIKDKM